MSHFFFFTLSHSHCVSLYLFKLHLLKLSLSLCVSCSLWNSHQKMAEWLSCFSFSLKSEWPLPFASFFSPQCVSHTCSALLEEASSLMSFNKACGLDPDGALYPTCSNGWEHKSNGNVNIDFNQKPLWKGPELGQSHEYLSATCRIPWHLMLSHQC